MKVLDDVDVSVRCDIDQTHPGIMQGDLKLEVNLPGDVRELQTTIYFVAPKPSGIN